VLLHLPVRLQLSCQLSLQVLLPPEPTAAEALRHCRLWQLTILQGRCRRMVRGVVLGPLAACNRQDVEHNSRLAVR